MSDPLRYAGQGRRQCGGIITTRLGQLGFDTIDIQLSGILEICTEDKGKRAVL